MAMETFKAIEKGRSVRRFQEKHFPDEAVQRAIEAAVLAPNSSNTQTWDFFWTKSNDVKKKLVDACLGQSAARTASHLIVVTADPAKWRRSNPAIIRYLEEIDAPKPVHQYYRKLIPIMYRWGFLNVFAPLKWLSVSATGLFRPIPRGPFTLGSLQTVGIKSAALACENFMLAITDQGGASCPMEGFDDCRVRSLLKLPRSASIVMVIGVGYESEKGTWGPRMRIPVEDVLHVL